MSLTDRSLGRRHWRCGPLVLLAAILAHPPASANADDGAAPPAATQLAGRLFLYVGDAQAPQHGLLAIDFKDGICATLCEDRMYPQRVAPDGQKVACQYVQQELRGTCVLDLGADGMPLRVSDKHAWPSWSSDGKRVLLSALDGATQKGEARSWTINADGTGIMPVTLPETEQVWDWSPDGQWVLASSSRRSDGVPVALPLDFRPLYLMRIDGREPRMLAPPGKPGATRTAGSRNTTSLCRPRFSPNGQEVLSLRKFETTRDGQPTPQVEVRLWVGDRDGRNSRFVFTGDDENGYPISAVWSPDGRSLAVVVTKTRSCRPALDCECRLLVIDSADGQNRREIPLPNPPFVTLVDWR